MADFGQELKGVPQPPDSGIARKKKPTVFGMRVPRKPRLRLGAAKTTAKPARAAKSARSPSRSFSRPKKSWLLKKFVTILKKAARSKRSDGYKRSRLRGVK